MDDDVAMLVLLFRCVLYGVRAEMDIKVKRWGKEEEGSMLSELKERGSENWFL